MNRTKFWASVSIVWMIGLVFLLLLWPTNDDWGYLTAPYVSGSWWQRMLPNGAFWRPWDALFGTLLNQNTGMFPSLNHIANYCGHCGGVFWYGKLAVG